MIMILQTIDWPDVVVGALVAALVGGIGFCVKLLIKYHLARQSILPYGKGTWYSAEYDSKGNVPKERRVTYLKVSMKPSLFGRVKVQCIEQLNPEEKPDKTGWIVEGRIQNGVLIGEWRTTVKDTIRFGSAMLRFLDNGRAVGYWIGVRGFDPPLYGYWIMSKDYDNLKSIISGAVPPGAFEMIDVAKRVADFERGSRGSRV